MSDFDYEIQNAKYIEAIAARYVGGGLPSGDTWEIMRREFGAMDASTIAFVSRQFERDLNDNTESGVRAEIHRSGEGSVTAIEFKPVDQESKRKVSINLTYSGLGTEASVNIQNR